jgi:hypothetical protein
MGKLVYKIQEFLSTVVATLQPHPPGGDKTLTDIPEPGIQNRFSHNTARIIYTTFSVLNIWDEWLSLLVLAFF